MQVNTSLILIIYIILLDYKMLYPANKHYFRKEAVYQVPDLEPRHGAEQLLHLLPGPGHAQAGQEEQTEEHLVSKIHFLLMT